MRDFHFVDEDFNILKGEDARNALEETSDEKYLSEDKGIVHVPRSRWEVAQIFERTGWMEMWSGAADDRNYRHKADFDDYQTLSGMTFDHAIELGCGPFTNLRLIAQVCTIKRCTLLDPLIMTYLGHKHCSYNKRMLRCESVLSRLLSAPKPLRGIRRIVRYLAPLLLVKQIPVHELIASPIEEMPVRASYDLIVIINVIEHCYDIDLVFDRIINMAAPDAVLVFHDKYYEHETVSQLVKGHYYEAGHPLMVDRSVIDGFLENHFEPLFRRTVQKSIEHIPVMPEYDGLFFIGRLRKIMKKGT